MIRLLSLDTPYSKFLSSKLLTIFNFFHFLIKIHTIYQISTLLKGHREENLVESLKVQCISILIYFSEFRKENLILWRSRSVSRSLFGPVRLTKSDVDFNLTSGPSVL